MSKKKIGILRGGNREHYEKSLQKGGEIILHIHENLNHKFKTIDILIDGNGVWHADGIPVKPAELVHKVDLVWNTSHPNFSVILKSLDIPTIGIDSFPFVLFQNRSILHDSMKEIGIKMPRHIVFSSYQEDIDGDKDKFILKKAKQVHEKFSPPWIVKSLTNDPYIGIHVAKTYPELINAIEDIVNHNKSILVEEFIDGKEIVIHTISGFREKEIYSMPVLEKISSIQKEGLDKIVKDIHKHFDVKHYLNCNFVLHPKRGVFLKHIDFLPDLKKDSHFHKSALYIGANSAKIIEHLIDQIL